MTVQDSASDSAPDTADRPLVPMRELTGLIKDWRRGRATRNLWEAFHDAYIALIGTLMVGAMVVNVVLQAQTVISSCNSESCLSARTVLPWAAFAVAAALALTASRLFGPVLASAAEGFWLLDAPVRRRALLAPRLAAATVVALVGGAAIGALVTALTGSGGAAVAVWAAAAGLSAAAAVAFSAAEQGIERHRLVHAFGYVFGVLGIVALLGVIGVAAGWFSLGVSTDRGLELGLVLIGFAVLVLVISLVLALIRLDRIRRQRLVSGGALVRGISGAFFALDIGLARDIVVQRRANELGSVTPQRGRAVGLQAVTWREWQRLRRFPQPLLLVAGSIVVPYAADALGMSTLTPVLAALVLFAVTVPMLGGLRVLTRTGGLARCLPFTLSQIKLASITVPAIVVGVWSLATLPAYLGFGDGAQVRDPGTALLMSVAVGAAGLLGAVRWTQAKGVDFGAPMVSTQAGAFPPGLIGNLFRGFDVCIITTAPMLLGGSPLWSLAIAAIAAFILLNSMDAESLRARQAEQTKALEAEKAKRNAAKAAADQRKR